MQPNVLPTDQLQSLIGQPQTPSDWFEVTQERVNAFADVTVDHQFIHIDPEQAAQSPFGGTIAHGFLTLSLLTHLAGQSMVLPEGTVMGVNYGFNKIRFLSPVRTGSRIRACATLVEVEQKRPGQIMLVNDVVVEIDGSDKPALIAQWVSLALVET